MPTKTFFNLKIDKRSRIIEAAIQEFATNMYSKSSINRIVAQANIAKGSFYQYFSGKDDLFKYIINILLEEEFAYSEQIINELEGLDFFSILELLFNKLVDFYKDRPESLAIIVKFMRMRDHQFKEEILENVIEESQSFFKRLLKEGIKNKDIDPKVDIEFIAYLLTDFIVNIIDYSFNEFNSKESMDQMVNLFNKVLVVLKEGIKAD